MKIYAKIPYLILNLSDIPDKLIYHIFTQKRIHKLPLNLNSHQFLFLEIIHSYKHQNGSITHIFVFFPSRQILIA